MNSRAFQVFALVRTVIFASLFIAGVLIYLPWAIGIFRWVSSPQPDWRFLGIVPLVCGACLSLYCIFAFAWTGLGTPAPFDPPRTLVIKGLYRYVRNPMYWGAFLILVGQWALFGVGWNTVIYIACFAGLTHLFVYFYEEPTLRQKFNRDYSDYCRNVPRWLPRLKPWKRSQGWPEP
ncbi:MAG TPA: isoprenylcysteine carboxylmethyltransferase family protein [Anaerolineales bacterium]|nr:isoprenylcysteine carboxylmethyltransferase family protein [Anaerolineales bacterium]